MPESIDEEFLQEGEKVLEKAAGSMVRGGKAAGKAAGKAGRKAFIAAKAKAAKYNAERPKPTRNERKKENQERDRDNQGH